jgi:peptidoglycan/LPS O-acetylase OafA/YrhL
VTTRGYWPQLDGIRALAIVAVIAFHLGYLNGGWIGVDIFFVLSGYLITTILLDVGDRASAFSGFWGRRARRLLPAVLVLLVVLSLYAWLGGPGLVPAQLRAPALATLFYTANWQQILSGHSYFAIFSAPSPLQHTWSLSIEEQYYLIWPLLLGVLLYAVRAGHIRNPRRVLIGLTLTLAAASAIWMGVADHLYGANRAYLGTDTRAWELLLGGAAAMLWPPGQTSRRPRTWTVLSGLGLLGLVAGALTVGGPPAWVWDGGLVALALGAGLLIVGSLRAPTGLPARLLTVRPLRWIGIISYSLYLWHWPVIVLMTTDSTGLSGAGLLAARLAAMTAAAVASYYVVERPLRAFDWGGFRRRFHLPVGTFVAAGLSVTAAIILVGTIGPPAAPSAAVSAQPSPATVLLGSVSLPPQPAGQPYRAWILGDSVMHDSSLGVQAALEATGRVNVVANTSFPGWGLTRDHQWPADAKSIIATNHPQIVLGTWSWDNEEAQATPDLYLQRLEGAIRTLLAPNDGVELVVLFEFPQPGPGLIIPNPATRTAAWVRQTQTQQAWDRVARTAVKAFPGHAIYLTTDQLFAPGGRFFTWFQTPTGEWLRARKLDNAHFCPYGAAEFGALAVAGLRPILDLPSMTPGWETGAWTKDSRYNDPPGACPNDQPPPGYHGVEAPVPLG